MTDKKILLGHGSGGRLMHALIQEVLLKKLRNPILQELSDGASLPYAEKLAFTTDSFVVNPLFFAGGDIGKLSVCGTVNDLVMMGAVPEHLSLGLILEEGLDLAVLERIVDSIAQAARRARVFCVTGDLKVVEKGACDKIFINTSGVGRMLPRRRLSVKNIRPTDRIIVTGEIGQHGMAVLSKRRVWDMGFNVSSDCAPLNDLILPVLRKIPGIRFMRDPTRGGVATTLNEVASASGLGVWIREKDIPVSGKVRAACELLGIDPLYVANEGRALIIVEQGSCPAALGLLRKHPLGRKARVIGEIRPKPQGRVVLQTVFNTQRILDMLTSEPLPRIC